MSRSKSNLAKLFEANELINPEQLEIISFASIHYNDGEYISIDYPFFGNSVKIDKILSPYPLILKFKEFRNSPNEEKESIENAIREEIFNFMFSPPRVLSEGYGNNLDDYFSKVLPLNEIERNRHPILYMPSHYNCEVPIPRELIIRKWNNKEELVDTLTSVMLYS